MIRKRLLIYPTLLSILPIFVAWRGLGVATTIALVAMLLGIRWLIVLSGIVAPERTPPIILDTISASHFVEKIRWCMDRLGLDYAERVSGGTLGAFFLGRTVPQLRIRTGLVQSVIGNSPEILRYLWGTYGAADERASFLEPLPERLELEKRLDRYGVNLQVWVYHHILGDRHLTLHAWGVDNPLVPWWQRQLLRLLFPLLALLIRRAFSTTHENYARAVQHIENLLTDIDTRLADGRRSILGGDAINYTDIAFAAMSGLWLQPEGYGGGMADTVRIARDTTPPAMRADIERWIEDHPKSTALIERMYKHARTRGAKTFADDHGRNGPGDNA